MHRFSPFRDLVLFVLISLLSFSCKPQLAKTEVENKVEPGLPDKSPFDEPDLPQKAVKGRSQAAVTGLLVSGDSGADFIGEASRMNATVLEDKYFGRGVELQFNQKVG